MLFVNDLNMNVAPAWLGHMEADFDGMGLADWVFPGFLFIVGMAIPFAFSKRLSYPRVSFQYQQTHHYQVYKSYHHRCSDA